MALITNRLLVFFGLIVLLLNPVKVQAAVDKGEMMEFEAGKNIMAHVVDAHDWHLWGHSSIPLPVIIYSKARGLDVFLSSAFHHGEMTWKGYMLNKDKKVVAVKEMESVPAEQATLHEKLTPHLWDFSITKNVTSLIISIILLCLIFISVANTYKRNPNRPPRGLQSFLEPIIIFVRDDVIKTGIGPKYEKYVPYLMTLFFFIWFNNMLGIIPFFPGGANLTGNIAIAMTMAVLTLIITSLSGNKHYWQHIFAMPGVPKWVLIILTPIELMGVILRPFVLMIRLFANIVAGHIIILSFFSLIFIFSENGANPGAGFGVGVVSLIFTVFMTSLEVLVAALQAYIFVFLSAIYIGSAVEEAHDHGVSHESI